MNAAGRLVNAAERREAPPRRLWLCADDYGMSPAVNRGIRELIARRRINATSVMVIAPSFSLAEAMALAETAAAAAATALGVAIGLHFTLTAPFGPRSGDARLTGGGAAFPSLPRTFATGLLRRLDGEALAAEAASQIDAFRIFFGRAPDFVDGHQHVQLLPQVSDVLLDAIRRAAPDAWIRQCGRAGTMATRLGDPKGLVLDALSARLRVRSAALGVSTNPAFAGTYNFNRDADYGALFESFLDGLPDGGLVMCHPGFVDPELRRLDPLTTMREREHSFFASERFLPLLAARGFALA